MAKAIREADGKTLLAQYFEVLRTQYGLGRDVRLPVKSATVTPDTDFAKLVKGHPWLETEVSYVYMTFLNVKFSKPNNEHEFHLILKLPLLSFILFDKPVFVHHIHTHTHTHTHSV